VRYGRGSAAAPRAGNGHDTSKSAVGAIRTHDPRIRKRTKKPAPAASPR